MMKRVFLLFSILLISCVFQGVLAQTVQTGAVTEYKETLTQRPLGGVELLISNAPTTVSDKKGKFSLQFQTLRPGQKVNIRRIEKSGYEIFNKDALEQWNINPDEPFVIIMVRSDRFKEIKDNYSRISSRSYEEQYLKEKERLQEEHEAGRLTVEQLSTEIVRLQEEYDRQLLNLDNYIDRFARIDLSSLTKVELEIIELVKRGEIDKAIQKYDELNLLEDYVQTLDDLQELQLAKKTIQNQIAKTERAKETISSQLQNNIDLLKLKGGRESFAKINQLYKEQIAADTTDIKIQNRYVAYCIEQNMLDDATATLERILSFELTPSQRVQTLIQLSGVHITTLDYESAKTALSEALEYLTQSYNQPAMDAYEIDLYKSQIYDNLGVVYTKLRDYDKAEDVLVKAHELRIGLNNEDNTTFTQEQLAKSKHNLANMYLEVMQFEKAVDLYTESISLYTALSNVDKTYEGALASTMNDLATCYQTFHDFANAEVVYLNCIDILKSLASLNPRRHNDILALVYSNLGTMCNSLGEYNKAIEYFKQSDDVYEQSEEFMTKTMMLSRAMMGNNWANSYVSINDLGAAKEMYLNSVDALNELGDHPFEQSNLYANLAVIEMYLGNLQESSRFYEKTMEILRSLYQSNPDAYCIPLGQVYLNVCMLYSQFLNDQPTAREYCDMAIANFEHAVNLNVAYNSFINISLTSKAYTYSLEGDYKKAIDIFNECIAKWPEDANLYDSKGEMLMNLKEYELAKQMWDKVMELAPDFLKTHQSALYDGLKEIGKIN